jgi:hypothetical protein
MLQKNQIDHSVGHNVESVTSDKPCKDLKEYYQETLGLDQNIDVAMI